MRLKIGCVKNGWVALEKNIPNNFIGYRLIPGYETVYEEKVEYKGYNFNSFFKFIKYQL